MTESPKSTGVSRRKFMALAGGAAGFAAMAAMGISARQGECSANIPEIDMEKVTVAENELTVVGAVPNPFSVVPVPIRYALLGNTSVRAQVANLRGFKVRDLGTFAGVVGENNILWDGLDDHGQLVPSGVYVVTIDGLGRSYQVKLAYTH